MNCCPCTFPEAKTYMLLPRHRQSVCYELASKCIASSLPQLELAFAQQPLNMESHTTGNNDGQQVAFTYVIAMDAVDLIRHIDVWETPAGFPVNKILLLQLLCHLLAYRMEYSLYD